MSLSSAVPGAQPPATFPASRDAVCPQHEFAPQARPAVRTAVRQANPLWLPTEVIALVVEALPREDALGAALVSRDWLEAAASTRSAALLLRCFEDLSAPEAAQALSFYQCLTQVEVFPRRQKLEGLISLARLQRGLHPSKQEQTFGILMEAACGLVPEDRCGLLCVLAISLAPSPGGGEAAWKTAALDRLAAAARTMRVPAQGLIVAALCCNRKNLDGASERFLAQLADLVSDWPVEELEKPACLFARKIRDCMGPGPITVEARRRLGHFGYFRLPFMTEIFDGEKTSARIAQLGRQILALDLEMADKLKILAHHDCWNFPWLAGGWVEDAERTGVAYVRAMLALPLQQKALVGLVSAGAARGAGLLSMLFAQLTMQHRLHRTIDITTLYINEIIGSAALEEPSKIFLLRSRMTGLPHTKAGLRETLPESVPVFKIGPGGDMPFCGLSLIDSLFADSTVRVMEAYMLTILRSTLTDAVKCAVLRLDYPDRTDLENMNIAHGMYNDTVRASNLPQAMKETLWNDVRTLFDRACVLV